MPGLSEVGVTLFVKGESPYFAMFRAGVMGISLEECCEECERLGVPLRAKDIKSWSDGKWKHDLNTGRSVLNPLPPQRVCSMNPSKPDNYRLDRFDKLPMGWHGTDLRWFPTNEDNMPMQRWGYAEGFTPNLYDKATAQALSPVGWVGQNMYAQAFIVMDIDGVGHGQKDEQVIEFGRKYSDQTECWEDPMKPGSFHLYFATDRVIPIRHYSYAKLDLMGNQKNAAVYMKNKKSNGIGRMPLTDEILEDLRAYVLRRKEQKGMQ